MTTNGKIIAAPPLHVLRESAFTGTSATHGFFPLLRDAVSEANEKEQKYYMREEEKIHQTLAHMEKCQLLTDQMLGILDSFDEKLSALESSMLPIHKGTQALTTAQKNIDSSLYETDEIILHYTTATESEESINSHLINSIDYVQYLEWVERIHKSINFFARNKERLQASGEGGSVSSVVAGITSAASSSNGTGLNSSSLTSSPFSHDYEKYLKKLNQLNKRVMADCEHEFERVLVGSSSTHKYTLDLTRIMASDASFSLVPELSIRELSCLARRMALAGNHTYYGVLLTQRSMFLKACLKKLFHEEWKGVMNTANTGSPLDPNVAATATRSGGSILSNGLHRGSFRGGADANSAATQPWGSVAPVPTSSSGGGGGGGLGALYVKHTHRSVFYMEYFLKLLEYENAFLLQALAHTFNPEDLQINGLYTANRDDASGGTSSTIGQSNSKLTSTTSSSNLTSSSTSSSSSSSLNLASLTTSATTGHLTVFWGQEAYDSIFSHIVEVPLEYFNKKIEQNTFLKEVSNIITSNLKGLFGVGSKKVENTGDHSSHGFGIGGGGGSNSHSSNGSSGVSLSNKILILLDVLDQLNLLLPRYRLILKKHKQFEMMIELQSNLITLCRKSLAEYREYLIDYSGKVKSSVTGSTNAVNMKDGTIYTLTVETLNFIKRLYDYRSIIESTTSLVDKHYVVASSSTTTSKDSSTSTPAASTPQDDSPLTRLVSYLLSGLELNMESHTKSFKLPSLSAIFLLNNFHYASRFIRKNESIFLVAGTPGNLLSTLDRYDRLVHTTMKQYRTVSWERIVSQSLEESDIIDLSATYNSAASGSSSWKTARKAIKAKWAFFNTHFDELYHTQRYFAIPDSDLRSQLRNDNVELVMHGYKKLYETFASINFSDTPAKYMKYRPDTLEIMLNKFFEVEETIAT